jgi:acyl-coenzyme A synthetase/AMP-(fatty) acid ligase
VVAVAGEPCPRPLADKWARFCAFYNSCGPTETTIVNTAERHYPWKKDLTIGKPTPNNTVYILNEKMEPCAIGEVGEMWAGGDCVSAGYIGNEPLTAERYVPDPFLGNGRMMFRTRDLGRWTENGELEHFGRTDDQVKIRGFRVELDSVSAALESVPFCKRAATLKLDNRHLVSFVSPGTVDVEAAKQAVTAALPYYCTPKFVLALEELPMTSRGKIDKRLLMKMAIAHDTETTQV